MGPCSCEGCCGPSPPSCCMNTTIDSYRDLVAHDAHASYAAVAKDLTGGARYRKMTCRPAPFGLRAAASRAMSSLNRARLYATSYWPRTSTDLTKVEVAGLRIYPGDLVHGNDDGLLTVPSDRPDQLLHLRHAFGKLGINSRVTLTRIASEHPDRHGKRGATGTARSPACEAPAAEARLHLDGHTSTRGAGTRRWKLPIWLGKPDGNRRRVRRRDHRHRPRHASGLRRGTQARMRHL